MNPVGARRFPSSLSTDVASPGVLFQRRSNDDGRKAATGHGTRAAWIPSIFPSVNTRRSSRWRGAPPHLRRPPNDIGRRSAKGADEEKNDVASFCAAFRRFFVVIRRKSNDVASVALTKGNTWTLRDPLIFVPSDSRRRSNWRGVSPHPPPPSKRCSNDDAWGALTATPGPY